MCHTYGAGELLHVGTQPLRAGLNCGVPTALGAAVGFERAILFILVAFDLDYSCEHPRTNTLGLKT
jgi:hypothetical protein